MPKGRLLSNMVIRNSYIMPQTTVLDCSPGEVLMASGGGRGFTTNIGLGYSVMPVDPNDAW